MVVPVTLLNAFILKTLLSSFPSRSCYYGQQLLRQQQQLHLISNLLGQADGYVAQHTFRGRVRDVLQGTLQDQGLIVSGLIYL